MTLHQGINQEVALMYIRYALSLGASSSEILIIAQASFRLVRAPMLGKVQRESCSQIPRL